MKTAACFKYLALAVVFVSALASCSRDYAPENSHMYTFALAEDDTRAVLAENARGKYGHWESGDRLGSAVSDVKPGYSPVNVGTPSTFSIYRPGGLTAGEILYVYYPYNSATQSVSAVSFAIPDAQNQTGTEFDFDAMPMAAAPFVIMETVVSDKHTALGDIHLYNLAAMAEFKLFSSSQEYAQETVRSVRFEADGPVAGAFSKDITAIVADDEASLGISVSGSHRVETSVESAPALGSSVDAAFRVYMVLAPGSYSGTVTVVTDKAEYSYSITSAQQFKRSVIRSFGVNLATGERKAPEEETQSYLTCYEVPMTESTESSTGAETFGSTKWQAFITADADRRVITHTYSYSGKVYRNYTAMIDRTKRCPLWTAYVMHNGAYARNGVGRVGKFNEGTSYDPGIPSSWQSSGSTSDYNNGNGYSRGHHCASNDRQANEDANKQTFYYTNQSPQWQNSFNGSIWGSLENAVQSHNVTGLDTLYVVVGTLFEDGNSGPSNDGGTVARPSHFYKLLMKCSFDSQGRVTAAKGCAFVYANQAHAKSSKYNDAQYITTIDAIEERAGFDFFPRVPAALQEAAESQFTAFL